MQHQHSQILEGLAVVEEYGFLQILEGVAVVEEMVSLRSITNKMALMRFEVRIIIGLII